MQLSLQKILNQSLLQEMLLLYFKEINPSKAEGGNLDYPYLESYFTDKDRLALQILYNDEVIGFVLINEWIVCKDFNADKSIAEFYIKPNFRRKGIGKKAAHHVFEMFKGKWEIRQSISNIAAITFWRTIINEYTNGNFQEMKIGDEVTQLF